MILNNMKIYPGTNKKTGAAKILTTPAVNQVRMTSQSIKSPSPGKTITDGAPF
jgi:hypothetical protein